MLDTLEMPALGRTFSLGELYDRRREESTQQYLFNQEKRQAKTESTRRNKTGYTMLGGTSAKEKLEDFKLEADVRVGVLAGLVSVGGSAGYFTSQASSTNVAATAIKFSTETEERKLVIDADEVDSIETAEELNATHVVVRILYGAEAIFEFEEDVEASMDKREKQAELRAQVDHLPNVVAEVGGSAGGRTSEGMSNKKEAIKCSFFGDIKLTATPVNYGDAVKLCKELPSK